MRKLVVLVVSLTFVWALQVGSTIPTVEVMPKNGGYVSGGTFNSTDFLGQVNTVMFVDPDKSDDGKALNDAIKKAADSKIIDRDKMKSFALIDLKSTWKPNFIIASILNGKQKKFPKTNFVKDDNHIIKNAWDMSEDTYTCIIIDKEGTVLFAQKAPFAQHHIDEVINLLAKHTH